MSSQACRRVRIAVMLFPVGVLVAAPAEIKRGVNFRFDATVMFERSSG